MCSNTCHPDFLMADKLLMNKVNSVLWLRAIHRTFKWEAGHGNRNRVYCGRTVVILC